MRQSLLLLLPILLAACGDPVVGGGGRLLDAPPGGLERLEVRGTPYEMGWWQGRLLRDRVQAHHARVHERAFPSGQRGRTLRSACLLYVDQTLRKIPEAYRQELQGLADASGVSAEDLLLTDVLRDGLRYHDVPLLLRGSLHWEAVGPRLVCLPSGPDGPVLATGGVVVARRPDGGTPTTLLSWPGSLGGVAGVGEGLAVVSVEADLPLERQTLSELPFTVRLRWALERADGTSDLVERLGGGTAHRVLVADGREAQAGEGAASRTTFALTGLASSEVADVSDMASAAWAEAWETPEGWSPQGVWLGPEDATAEAPAPDARPRWTLRWEDGAWTIEVAR